jgi:hypothetical protein
MFTRLGLIGSNPRVAKILITLSFVLITLSLLVIAANPSNGSYEFSIYSAYPWYFWASVLSSIIIGQVLILSRCYSHSNKVLLLSGVAILFSNTILLCLPILRGYVAFGRGDVLTHIGWMKDILQTGYIGIHDIYPLNHILGVSFSFASGMNLYDVTMVIPIFFSLFLTITVFLFAREILETRWQIILATVIGSIMLFGTAQTSFAPFQQSIFLFPFTLFLFFKSRSSSKASLYRAMFLFYLVFVAFYHPLSAVFMIAILIVMEQGMAFSKWAGMVDEKKSAPFQKMQKVSNLVLIAFVVCFMWNAYTKVVRINIWNLLNSLNSSSDSSQLASYTNIINSNNLSIVDILGSLFTMYGQYVILIIITTLGMARLLHGMIKLGHKQSPITLMLSYEFSFFIIASIVTSFIVYIVGFGRYLIVSVIFCIFLLPLLMDSAKFPKRFGNIKPKPYLQSIALMILVFTLLMISTLSLYASPTVRSINYQVTETEFVGMDGFNHMRVMDNQVFEMGTSQYRMYDALYGRDSKSFTTNEILYSPPDHFGYLSNQSWTGNSSSPKYLLLTDAGRYFYPEIYPDFSNRWRFTNADFTRLMLDSNVTKLYDNSNLDIYWIN